MSSNSRKVTKTSHAPVKARPKRAAPGTRKGKTGSQLYWRDMSLEAVYAVLTAVSEAGGAPMFIRSSDGGALGVRVYHDDVDLENVWGDSYERVTELLHEIAEDYAQHKRRED